jgi:hypothetical protein
MFCGVKKEIYAETNIIRILGAAWHHAVDVRLFAGSGGAIDAGRADE